MVSQTTPIAKLDQLPAAARDRIEQLRLLFIDRSKGHLTQIQQILVERQTASELLAADANLMKLAHSLVGTSGIFGFQALGEAAFKVESILRETGYKEADFAEAMAGLIDQLNSLD